MRIRSIACAAIYLATAVGCSGELAQRPAANDPGDVAATEAPYRRPPSYEPDPLLSPVPPRSAEPPPTGHEQAHSPTATPPGNPPMREEPGAKTPAHPHEHGAMPGMQHRDQEPAASVYTCPMHPAMWELVGWWHEQPKRATTVDLAETYRRLTMGVVRELRR